MYPKMKKIVTQLRVAVRAHQQGELQSAAAIYQKILTRQPNHADALHLLGVVLAETGRYDTALACIGEAIRSGGPRPAYCANLGRVFMRQQRFTEAVACFRQALRHNPLDAGVTMQLARGLAAVGNLTEAETAFAQAAAIDPGMHEAHFNLGILWTMQQRVPDACRSYERALKAWPDYADAHNNLANLLHAQGDTGTAQFHYESACRLTPDQPRSWFNLGRLFQDTDRIPAAHKLYDFVLARWPDHAAARINLGNCLRGEGQSHEAIEHYRRVIAHDPEDVDAHWNLSLALLQTGQMTEGWKEYDWRFQRWPRLVREFSQPLWNGEMLDGRRILLHAEQGLGDTLQFARFASIAKDRGGIVILECHSTLVRLLRSLRGVDEVVARGCDLPEFDCHAPLLSLPAILGTLPVEVPYIATDKALSNRWRERVRTGADGLFRIGLAWAGDRRHGNDRHRSMAPEYLKGLSGLESVRFFSLQKDHAPVPGLLPHLDPINMELTDFADTAAIMHHLDLIISVDTSVAHLAGALARPVWTLLPFSADWRWLDSHDDSSWYPTMRLFRQPQPQDWTSVMAKVRAELIPKLAQVVLP